MYLLCCPEAKIDYALQAVVMNEYTLFLFARYPFKIFILSNIMLHNYTPACYKYYFALFKMFYRVFILIYFILCITEWILNLSLIQFQKRIRFVFFLL